MFFFYFLCVPCARVLSLHLPSLPTTCAIVPLWTHCASSGNIELHAEVLVEAQRAYAAADGKEVPLGTQNRFYFAQKGQNIYLQGCKEPECDDTMASRISLWISWTSIGNSKWYLVNLSIVLHIQVMYFDGDHCTATPLFAIPFLYGMQIFCSIQSEIIIGSKSKPQMHLSGDIGHASEHESMWYTCACHILYISHKSNYNSCAMSYLSLSSCCAATTSFANAMAQLIVPPPIECAVSGQCCVVCPCLGMHCWSMLHTIPCLYCVKSTESGKCMLLCARMHASLPIWVQKKTAAVHFELKLLPKISVLHKEQSRDNVHALTLDQYIENGDTSAYSTACILY